MAIALVAVLLLRPYSASGGFLLFVAAVTLAAWYGGRGPALLATAVAIPLLNYFFLSPAFAWTRAPADLVRLAGFSAIAILISAMRHSLDSARRQAEGLAAAAAAAQERTAESEARFRHIADFAPVLIWTSGTDSLCNFFNRPWLEFTGRSMEQEMGNGWAEGVHPDDLQRCIDTYRSAFEARRPFTMEYRLRRYDGEYRALLDNGVPRFTPSGEFLGFIGACIDVEDRAQQHAALEESTEQLRTVAAELEETVSELQERTREAELARVAAEAANRAKSNFLATISHEIRTPINAIVGFADLLELGIAGRLNQDQRAYVGRVQGSAQHLVGIVDEILDMAKIEAGELSVSSRRAWGAEALDVALTLIRPAAGAKGIDLVDSCDRARDTTYFGDPERVQQILVKLLGNAVKFTEPGGRVVVDCDTAERIAHRPGRSSLGSWVCIRVEDTGIGIAPEQLAEIFEPFVQGDPGLTRARGGTGLGLTIARRLARLMGGDITVDSRPGEGSCFALWLPAASARRPSA